MSKRVTITWTESATYQHTYVVPDDWQDVETEPDGESAAVALIVSEQTDFLTALQFVSERDVTDVRPVPEQEGR